MQPELPRSGQPSAEQLPVAPVMGPESVPNLPPLEGAFERGRERFEQAAEAGARASDAASPMSQVAPVVAPPPVQDTSSSPPVSSATPLVAADEDLIEKEWVDKAKEIIEQTRDDPRARTERVNELQRDYLQKRYGKVVGASE